MIVSATLDADNCTPNLITDISEDYGGQINIKNWWCERFGIESHP